MFPEVWREENPGFDAIIGNPPYVRIQTLQKHAPEAAAYLRQHYAAARGSFDLYMPFLERGLALLSPEGVLGFIVPNKWARLETGAALRGLLASHIAAMVDFGDRQVFPGQTTYTALVFLHAREPEAFRYVHAPQKGALDEWLFREARQQMYALPRNRLGQAPWRLAAPAVRAVMEKMEADSTPLGEMVDQIFQGIITGDDKIYLLEKLADLGTHVRVRCRLSGDEWELEKPLLKPLVSGEHVERFFFKESPYLLLFPYRLLPNGEVRLYSSTQLARHFPRAWASFPVSIHISEPTRPY
jgi:hypothetical protein